MTAPNTDLRVQQHQLRAARADRGEGRRPSAGGAVPGPPVRAAGIAADVAYPQSTTPRFRRRTPMATCMGVRPMRWSTTRIPPTSRPPRKAGTLQPIDYTNQNPSYAHAAGGVISTADDIDDVDTGAGVGQGLQRRLPTAMAGKRASRGPGQSRRAEVRVRHLVSAVQPDRRDVLPRRRDAGLQLVHGIRPG